jgi:uracil-DNA glycosylase
MGVTVDEFYDETRIAILPMGFCFPGLSAKGADLPPRAECAPLWRARALAELANIELVLLIGRPAQTWHLGTAAGSTLAERVRAGAAAIDQPPCAAAIPLPHPSWRNSGWLKRNPWFADEIVPALRLAVRSALSR